jgi:hypothetical protein
MMRNIACWVGGVAVAIALASTPIAGTAQVLAIGPNGQLGYVTTPNPISPNCIAPQVWTRQSNGVYLCANPAPPPPTCPTGFTQTSAPVWNGSSWTGLGCQPVARQPPLVTPQDEAVACVAYLAKYMDPWYTVSLNGPANGSGMDQYNSVLSNLLATSGATIATNRNGSPQFFDYGAPGSPASNDLFWGTDGSSDWWWFCWVAPGSTNVSGARGVAYVPR